MVDVFTDVSLLFAGMVAVADDDTEIPLLFDALEVVESEFRTEITFVESVRSSCNWLDNSHLIILLKFNFKFQ